MVARADDADIVANVHVGMLALEVGDFLVVDELALLVDLVDLDEDDVRRLLDDAAQVACEHGHLLLLHLDGRLGEALSTIEEKQPVADLADHADGAVVGGVVVGFVDGVERGIELEVVSSLFAVGLLPLEIMHGGRDRIARLLVGANRVHFVPHEQQHLVGDHDLIVLDVVAGEEEDFFLGHGKPR